MAMEKFHYTTNKSGKKLVLPRWKQIPVKTMRRLRREDELNFVFELVEELGGKSAAPALDDMDLGELQDDFFTAWQTDSEVSAGESEAS